MNIKRLVSSVVAALLVTFAGAAAFMQSVHSPSPWLQILQVVGLPFAAIASRFGFFESNVVYWGSLVSGLVLWSWLFYVLFTSLAQRGHR
jgi:hypothetical protein